MLAARPRSPFANRFGVFLLIDGAAYAVFALAGGYTQFPHKELIIPSHVVSITASLVTAGLLLAAFWPDVRRLPESRLESVVGFVAGVAALLLNPFMFFVADEHPPFEDYGSTLRLRFGEADSVAFSVYVAALCVVGAALLARVRHDRDDLRSPARLLLAVHFILSAVILAGVFEAIATYDDLSALARTGFLVASATLLLLPLCFLGLGRVAGWSRWVPIGFLLACYGTAALEAVLLGDDLRDGGFGGIVSLAGLAAVGYAIFRLDLLGVRVPRPRAGLVAAFGLAALFITAQLVQNFASSKFSLGTGAIVAGLAVLLANPLQKRIEGLGKPQAPTGAAAKYRRLVETAWKDGKLGANERLLLAEARRQLGLDAETATAVDEDVAGQHASRPARSQPPESP